MYYPTSHAVRTYVAAIAGQIVYLRARTSICRSSSSYFDFFSCKIRRELEIVFLRETAAAVAGEGGEPAIAWIFPRSLCIMTQEEEDKEEGEEGNKNDEVLKVSLRRIRARDAEQERKKEAVCLLWKVESPNEVFILLNIKMGLIRASSFRLPLDA